MEYSKNGHEKKWNVRCLLVSVKCENEQYHSKYYVVMIYVDLCNLPVLNNEVS